MYACMESKNLDASRVELKKSINQSVNRSHPQLLPCFSFFIVTEKFILILNFKSLLNDYLWALDCWSDITLEKKQLINSLRKQLVKAD